MDRCRSVCILVGIPKSSCRRHAPERWQRLHKDLALTMDHREKLYKQFKTEFDRGLRQIADIDKVPLSPQDRNWEVNSACAIAIERLGETGFGQKLVADEDLTRIAHDLEAGLSKVVDELRETPQSEPRRTAVSWADQCGEERQFKFLGGIGRIFNYFRDGPYFLDTKREKLKRESLRDAAGAFIEQADSLLFHITAELMYNDEVVSAIRRLSDDANQLKAQLANSPIDRRDGQNPFHDGGETIIVRQFSHAVSLLGFELYGWVNPRLLTGLLEMKATTADEYGLPLWLLDAGGDPIDRDRKLRKFITGALNDARKATKHPEWRTHEMIEFFSRNRKRFTERDGLKTASH